MVPAAVVDATLEDLAPCLGAGDVVVDGGNSYYRDDIERAKQLAERGLHFVDCGTSGGVWGVERGYCLMIGGEPDVVQRLDPLFATLAPGAGAISPTPNRARRSRHGRAGLPPLRPERCRAFRQDGAQRHRVRADGGLRRGLQHPAARERREARPGGGRGDDAAPQPGALPVRPEPGRHRGSVAARQRDRLVAPRSDGGGAGARSDARGLLRTGVGLRRGALDARRRHRRSGARARPRRRAVRALRLAGRGRLPGPAALGHAASGSAATSRRDRGDERAPLRCARFLRRQRRSRRQEDLPGACTRWPGAATSTFPSSG